MNKLFTKEIKEKIIVGTTVGFFTILFYFLIKNVPVFYVGIQSFISMCAPFIFGVILAFFLNPFLILIEELLLKKFKFKYKRLVSIIIIFIILLLFLLLVLWLVLPTTLSGLWELLSNAPTYIENASKALYHFANRYNISSSTVDNLVGSSSELVSNANKYVSDLIASLATLGVNILIGFSKFIIGLFATFYLLLSKEYFVGGLSKLNIAIFPNSIKPYINTFNRMSKDVLYDFVVGKFIDSLIIGIISYIILWIFRIDYVEVLAVLIGITNMIPVFGPIVGTAIGVIILLLIAPYQALIFFILIVIIKQFDIRLLSPKLLGTHMSINTFWILFSVTLGGNLFGVMGMFIGLPVFVIFYFACKNFTQYLLDKKGE